MSVSRRDFLGTGAAAAAGLALGIAAAGCDRDQNKKVGQATENAGGKVGQAILCASDDFDPVEPGLLPWLYHSLLQCHTASIQLFRRWVSTGGFPVVTSTQPLLLCPRHRH